MSKQGYYQGRISSKAVRDLSGDFNNHNLTILVKPLDKQSNFFSYYV